MSQAAVPTTASNLRLSMKVPRFVISVPVTRGGCNSSKQNARSGGKANIGRDIYPAGGGGRAPQKGFPEEKAARPQGFGHRLQKSQAHFFPRHTAACLVWVE